MDSPNKKAFDFLKAQHVAVLSTVSVDGKPHAATVYYIVDDDFNFYFFTKDGSQKYLDLKHDNAVAITVFTEEVPMIVQASGSAQQLDDTNETLPVISELVDVAMNSSKWYDPPIAKFKGGNTTVFKVTPTNLRFADFTGGVEGMSAGPFHQIIS